MTRDLKTFSDSPWFFDSTKQSLPQSTQNGVQVSTAIVGSVTMAHVPSHTAKSESLTTILKMSEIIITE